jgi:hypothetical protein
MNLTRIPLWLLPILAFMLAGLGALFASFIDQAHLRGAYQVWQENETFAAATVALFAAMLAARPVYMQVRAQSVQAALDLLHRTEADTEACIEARNILFALRRVVLVVSGEINAYASVQTKQHLEDAVAGLMAIAPQDLVALSERPTINHADQMKLGR